MKRLSQDEIMEMRYQVALSMELKRIELFTRKQAEVIERRKKQTFDIEKATGRAKTPS